MLEFYLDNVQVEESVHEFTFVELLSMVGGLVSFIILGFKIIGEQINNQYFDAMVLEKLYFVHEEQFKEHDERRATYNKRSSVSR